MNKAFILGFIFAGGFCYSQSNTSKKKRIEALDEVIVSATRSKRMISTLPLPAQVIGKKKILATNAARLTDVLNEQTGLIMIPGHGYGNTQGIQLQGLSSEYTLILIDGMPLVGRTSGTLDLNRISIGNIKQIEIVKGASSSLYGSDALGGLINIITETPKNGLGGMLSYRGASFGTHDVSATVDYKKNRVGVNAFFDRYNSEGYDLQKDDSQKTVEPFFNNTITGKITYDIFENTSLYVSGRYYRQRQKRVLKQNSKSLSGWGTIEEWNSHFKLDHAYNNMWNSYLELYATGYKTTNRINDNSGENFTSSYFDQTLKRAEFRTAYKPQKRHSFLVGVGFTHEQLDRTYALGKPILSQSYAYIQYEGHILDRLNVIFGSRFDHHNKYKSQFSPKIAFRYEIIDNIAIKGSLGYGFKAPDFRQMYLDFSNPFVGYTVLGYNAVTKRIPELQASGEIINLLFPISNFNDKLNAERSINLNIGMDFHVHPNLKLHLNLFRNNIRDIIDTRAIARKTNGMQVFSYYNTGMVFTQGVEFNSTWNPIENISLSAGYQLLFAKDVQGQRDFKNGKVFVRLKNNTVFRLKSSDYFGLFNRSRHMANFKVFYTIPKWNGSANIRATYRSKYGLYDSNGNGYLDRFDTFVKGYMIWDMAIKKTFHKNYTISLGIDNMFHFTDLKNISSIPGRIYYGKIMIKI